MAKDKITKKEALNKLYDLKFANNHYRKSDRFFAYCEAIAIVESIEDAPVKKDIKK